MFWFKIPTQETIDLYSEFKYIICFGSRIEEYKLIAKFILFKYIICFGSSGTF